MYKMFYLSHMVTKKQKPTVPIIKNDQLTKVDRNKGKRNNGLQNNQKSTNKITLVKPYISIITQRGHLGGSVS